MAAGQLPAGVRAWRDGGGRIELGVHRVFVREHTGTGPPILLLHGYPSSSYDWRGVVARLPERRLTTLDFLGFGLSDKPPDHEYSLLGQADLVEALAARYRSEPVVLVAHDMATSVVTELLARDLENRLSFSIAAVLLFKSPVGVHPPEEPAVMTYGFFVLTRTARVANFRDASGTRPASAMRRVDGEVPNLMVGVEGDCDDLFFPQSVENLEIVAIAADQS